MSMNIKRDDRNDIKTEKRKQFFFLAGHAYTSIKLN